VPEPGFYDLTARVASRQNRNKSFSLELNATPLENQINFNTGGAGWQQWQSVDGGSIFLEEGSHELKIIFTTGGFNLNYIDLSSSNPPYLTGYGINSGGNEVEDYFLGDYGFSGGRTYGTTQSIDTTSAPLAAPETLYQSSAGVIPTSVIRFPI